MQKHRNGLHSKTSPARFLFSNGGGKVGFPKKGGFTLLEVCLVLALLVLFLGFMVPSVRSALVEQQVRRDAVEFTALVKKTMGECSDKKISYLLTVDGSVVKVRPEFGQPKEEHGEGGQGTREMSFRAGDVVQLLNSDPGFDPSFPIAMVFRPGELCPATRIRISRGKAWLEASFNPLTGNCENLASYFP